MLPWSDPSLADSSDESDWLWFRLDRAPSDALPGARVTFHRMGDRRLSSGYTARLSAVVPTDSTVTLSREDYNAIVSDFHEQVSAPLAERSVDAMLDEWHYHLHLIPDGDRVAGAALDRIDRGHRPSRTTDGKVGSRTKSTKDELWDCLIIETVFHALKALDEFGCAHRKRVFPSSNTSDFQTAAIGGERLQQEFAQRNLLYARTFDEALSKLSFGR